MHSFKDFDIKPNIKAFIGDKISVKKLFNLPITVLEFKVEPSTQKPGTDCLHIQIEKSGEKRVIFTGSKVLMDQIKRVPEKSFPFTTTIKGDNDYYEFT
jgi:hypothetical protein